MAERRKGSPASMRAAAQALTPDALDALAQVMRSGSSEHARIAAAAAILDRAHSQRLAAVEERARDMEGNSAALAVLTATVGGIDKRLAEVALDVKNLLTGRVRPVSRRDAES